MWSILKRCLFCNSYNNIVSSQRTRDSILYCSFVFPLHVLRRGSLICYQVLSNEFSLIISTNPLASQRICATILQFFTVASHLLNTKSFLLWGLRRGLFVRDQFWSDALLCNIKPIMLCHPRRDVLQFFTVASLPLNTNLFYCEVSEKEFLSDRLWSE